MTTFLAATFMGLALAVGYLATGALLHTVLIGPDFWRSSDASWAIVAAWPVLLGIGYYIAWSMALAVGLVLDIVLMPFR